MFLTNGLSDHVLVYIKLPGFTPVPVSDWVVVGRWGVGDIEGLELNSDDDSESENKSSDRKETKQPVPFKPLTGFAWVSFTYVM